MNGLLAMLNHLAAAALSEGKGGGALHIRSLTLEPEGGRLVARVDHPLCSGELVLRLEVDAPRGSRQTLHLVLESVPAELAPALEPFRRVLEKARLHLDLDFES